MINRMPASQYAEMVSAKAKRPQRVVNAKRTTVDGIIFASKKEARRYGELVLLQAAGEIFGLERQRKIELQGQMGPILTPTGRKMIYRADFCYRITKTGAWVVEDVKSGDHRTEVYSIKRAILSAQGINVVEV